MTVINDIKPRNCRVQSDIRFRQLATNQVLPSVTQNLFESVEGFKKGNDGVSVRLRGRGEPGLVDSIVDCVVNPVS